MQSAITLRHVSKTFRVRPGHPLVVLRDIDLTVHQGEILVVLGPSGSGKSTLLRLMCGLVEAEGQVELGAGLGPADFSFVFQQFALLPWLTITDNVALGLRARHVPTAQWRQRVAQELEIFGLQKFAQVRPRELSGGMQQRVGIARALATDPKIILMDEPFSELDSFTASELRQELLHVWQERRPTIVLVTHIIEDALLLADRIAVLTPRPGHIEKIITNHLPRPRQRRSEAFYQLEDQLYELVKP